MARSLDQMLEPGEKVVLRNPRLRMSRVRRTAYGVAMLVCLAVGTIHSFWDWPADWIVQVASSLFFFMGMLGGALLQAAHTETLVTDRRILHKSGWHWSRIDEFTLAGIRGNQFMGHGRARSVKVMGPLAEHVVLLNAGQDADRIAGILAQAANLPPPRQPSSKVNRAAWLVHGAGDVCGVAAFLGAGLGLVIVAMGVGDPEPSIWAVAAFASLMCLLFPAILAGVIGGPLGSAAMMLCLRPFVSRAEMGAALDFKSDQTEGAADSGFIVWKVRILERFARLLYGGPAQREPEGHGNG